MAAGLSMEETAIPLMQERLEANCTLRKEDLTDVIHIDMELPPALWTTDMAEELHLLEPCGTANPRPMFAARGIYLHSVRIMGKGRNVLRFEGTDDRGTRLTLLRFQEAALFKEELVQAAGSRAWDELCRGGTNLPVSIVYYPEINEWRGRKTLQFVIRDMKVSARAGSM